MRLDADGSSNTGWVTLESGNHVKIEEGEVVSGAGGSLNGKKLSSAKSVPLSTLKKSSSSTSKASSTKPSSKTSGSSSGKSAKSSVSGAAITSSGESSRYASLLSSSPAEQVKTLSKMSMEDALGYFEYTAKDDPYTAKLRQDYESGSKSDFRDHLYTATYRSIGRELTDGGLTTWQKMQLLTNSGFSNPRDLLSSFGSTDEDKEALNRCNKINSKSYYGSWEKASAMGDAVQEIYQDAIAEEQKAMTSALSGAADTEAKLEQLKGLSTSAYDIANCLYQNGASDAEVDQSIASSYGMSIEEYNAAVNGQETAAESGSSEQKNNNSDLPWLTSSSGKFLYKGKEYSPSTEEELYDSDYAIDQEGHVYQQTGEGRFTDLTTGERDISSYTLEANHSLAIDKSDVAYYQKQEEEYYKQKSAAKAKSSTSKSKSTSSTAKTKSSASKTKSSTKSGSKSSTAKSKSSTSKSKSTSGTSKTKSTSSSSRTKSSTKSGSGTQKG